jgi:hypothetical protein
MRWTAIVLGLLVTGVAQAAPSPQGQDGSVHGRSTIQGKVEAMPVLSAKKHRWLKPRHHLLGANPRNNTDFTAYTLELGEVKVGLASITVGVAPRTQLATVPLLNLIGVYNGSLKINAIHAGPLDIAFSATYHRLSLGEFVGSYAGAGGMASLTLHRNWSIHGGASYTHIHARGLPDFSKLSPLLSSLTKGQLDDFELDPDWFDGGAPEIRGEVVSARVATEVRFNRRDSLIVQASAMIYAKTSAQLPILPPILNMDKVLDHDGAIPIRDTYVASVAYQASWKQFDLRIGAGLSSVKYAWLLQSTELSYRFGGKTRRTESRQKKHWRKNRKDIGESPV